jgi:hypothetical protein
VDAAGNVHRLERVDAFEPRQTNTSTAAANGTVAPRSSAAPAPESQARLVPASLRTSDSEPEPSSAPAPASESVATAATIAGCLVQDENTFWLKDVSGDAAPKSRSWKSGFLRKKAPSIELVDRGSGNRLAPYVGQKIETTGALTDREMRVKTVRVLGSCE